MPTTTTTYSFNKPVVGADEDSWGGYLNGNWDSVDDLLDGTTPITGIDINSGTLDGVTIGGTTAGAGTFTTLTANTSITGTLATAAQPNVTSLGTLTSLTVSGDVSFGDNDKAIFGAGSDLQIYHDGSRSIIQDNGTGNLRIQANNLELNNADNSENYLFAANNGAVTLYYDNAAKLATTSTGIDVTGTVTADGLTSSGTIKAETTAGGFVTLKRDDTTLTNNADVGAINFETTDTDDAGVGATILGSGDGASGGMKLRFYTGTASDKNERLLINATGDISFYEDTGTTPKFFWDASAESLGIGTTSPSSMLHVKSPAFTDSTIHIDATSSNVSQRIDFRAAGTLTSRIYDDATKFELNAVANKYMTFRTNNTEAMRIDSSGNLLVGVTSDTDSTNVGVRAKADGFLGATRAGSSTQPTAYFNKKTNDGVIAGFYKDGTTVGSIGSQGSDSLTIGNGDTGLLISAANDVIHPWNTSTNAARDNAIDLGRSSHRFKDLYLSGGVYLGGTGSANKLDDYETGTWTAQLSDGTNISSTTATGYYTKVGRIVHCMVAQFTNISTSGMSGILRLSLPFTPSSGGFYSSGTAAMFSGSFPSNTYALRTSIYHGETLGYLQAVGTSGASSLSTSNITSGTTDIAQITFSYITA
jgi:hypothetical protein